MQDFYCFNYHGIHLKFQKKNRAWLGDAQEYQELSTVAHRGHQYFSTFETRVLTAKIGVVNVVEFPTRVFTEKSEMCNFKMYNSDFY